VDEDGKPDDAESWRPTFTPRGSRISDRVVVPPGNAYDAVRHALSAIDAVHGDGLLRPVRVRRGRSQGEAASYEWNLRTGEPRYLTLSVSAPRPELSIVHEIGHFLDHEGIGRGGLPGSESGEVSAVMDAVYGSQAYQHLAQLATRKQVQLRLPNRSRPQAVNVDPAIVQYLREPGELFARAYAQLIATTTQDVRLVAQLEHVQADLISDSVYHVQWGARDFVPIARAFEQEFRGRQWIA
jgi:hypothetical protein